MNKLANYVETTQDSGRDTVVPAAEEDLEEGTGQKRFHLRTKKRKAGATFVVLLTLIGIVGYQLASLQFGLEKPTEEAIAIAETNSPTATPPPPISTYGNISVPVEHNISVTVHLRENPDATDNIFLVHGAGGGAWAWEEYFDLVPDNYNLYAISWRGHFTSSPVDDADTSDYVADQLAVMEAIGARNELPTHVVGHSYGAATSVLATAQEPEQVASLHLLAPVVPLDYTFVQAIAVPLVMPPILNSSTSSEIDAIEQGTGATGTYTGMFLDQAQMNRYWDLYQGKLYSVEKRSLIGVDGMSPDWQDKLNDAYLTVGDSDIPVWFITARYDNVVVPAEQQETADDIDADLIELESGHYIQLDAESDESIEIILGHLA